MEAIEMRAPPAMPNLNLHPGPRNPCCRPTAMFRSTAHWHSRAGRPSRMLECTPALGTNWGSTLQEALIKRSMGGGEDGFAQSGWVRPPRVRIWRRIDATGDVRHGGARFRGPERSRPGLIRLGPPSTAPPNPSSGRPNPAIFSGERRSHFHDPRV